MLKRHGRTSNGLGRVCIPPSSSTWCKTLQVCVSDTVSAIQRRCYGSDVKSSSTSGGRWVVFGSSEAEVKASNPHCVCEYTWKVM
jgi:hypothetical protein